MSRNGFTLVELLVVITIMGLVGAYTLSNYSNFGEEQKLRNATLDVQSLLRQAQANASSNVKCSSQYSAAWQVVFSADGKTVDLNCVESDATYPKRKVQLDKISPNITIQPAVVGTGSGCPTSSAFTADFALLTGKINLVGINCTSVKITLSNSKTSGPKDLIIEQGGRIYVQ